MLVRLSVPGPGPHGGPRPHPAYGNQLNEQGVPGVAGEGEAAVPREAVRSMATGDRQALLAFLRSL
ncbi:hypothetical protein [Endothiovibrio diazotrophicus]